MQMSKRALKKLAVAGSALVSLVGMTSAHAAIDVTAITTGITDAQTALTTIITALLALSTALFGLVKVYAFVKRRAGA